MNSSRTRQAPALLLASLALLGVVALLTGVGSATANPIQSKKAQAQAVLAQIQESDVQLEKAIEAYNYANVQLDQIDTDLHSNANHLVVAQKSLNTAQLHIADRLRALYVNGDGGGAVEILLGAQNLDDLLGRLDMVQRVGDQDAKVLGDVVQFRKEVKERRERLKTARERQAEIVADRASQKRSIESQLAERQRMLAGIQTEIKQLQAAEARRQAQLRVEAEARIAAQQRSATMARTAATEIAADSFTSAIENGNTPSLIPAAPPSQYGGVVGIAMQELGKPYVWGAAGPELLRLLRPRDVRRTPRSASPSRTTPPHSTATAAPSRTTTSSQATSSSSRASATSASTSAAASSSMRRTPVTSSRSRASAITAATSAPAACRNLRGGRDTSRPYE